MLEWKTYGEQFFVATKATGSYGTYKLAVEQLPDSNWDWVVWSAEGASREGVAGSARDAMADAEESLARMAA